MTRFYVRACCVAFCAFLFSSAANFSSAATILGPPVPFDSLLAPDASILVGDKLFEDFTYAPTGDMPPAAGVNVIPILDDWGNYGIRFQGAFIDTPGTLGGSDALITFNVTATDPKLLISDAHLAGNTVLRGIGLASVTETFLPLFEDMLVVFDSPGSHDLQEEVVFGTPVRTLPVQKDILMLSLGSLANGDFAIMSFVDQTFSQVPDPNQNEIAEPATLGLASLVGLFFGAIYMRRRLG